MPTVTTTDIALQVRLLGKLDQRRRDVGPAVAAIGAAEHPADLERGIDVVRPVRIDRDAQYPGVKAGTFAMRGRYRLRQPAPGFTSVEAPIKRDRCCAGVHDVGPSRMNRKRPDHDAAIGKTEPLPMIAIVGAAVWAILRSGEDEIRVV